MGGWNDDDCGDGKLDGVVGYGHMDCREGGSEKNSSHHVGKDNVEAGESDGGRGAHTEMGKGEEP